MRLARRIRARWLANAAYDAARRSRHHPPRLRNGSVDWAAIDSYVLLADAAHFDMPWTLEDLLAGPMGRFIDLCADESVNIRVRAREMEFARGVVAGFKHRRARSEKAKLRVDETVLAELGRRLGPQGSHGRYLIDVYLGNRDHNG
ncbi:hypothetical protein [Brevundimonas sp.]|uniref:hypothetical protein n=1 Tax=Brevundimonas sp. TaxID=1871086 RepID=UPI0011F4E489|nr:hypothetical protein [Brevundimonas sp.]TAJ62531.1 MAG: hypothetical protein EPO49_08400 [Brevundimonas sp.]